MLNAPLVALLLGHVLGDFFFQSEDVAQRKTEDRRAFLYHVIVYAVSEAVVAFVILGWSVSAMVGVAFLALSHAAIDAVKPGLFRLCARFFDGDDATAPAWVFCIDQIAHILCIVLAASLWFARMGYEGALSLVLGSLGIEESSILPWLLALLLVSKPANVVIRVMLGTRRPDKGDSEGGEPEAGLPRTGATIGSLERFISLILIWLGQYAALALVLTAKSIARFDQISKNPRFAEYYLLGTLSSLAMALVVALLVFGVPE